jgi:uncharacterized integral membrane protein (TIGR00698 family)
MSATLQPGSRSPLPDALDSACRLAPGIALCIAVTLVAMGLERIEAQLSGRAWLDALVLAILIGTALRTAWAPGERWKPGIGFSAKTLLEIAVVLLGASLSAATLLAVGYGMLFGIAGIVVVAIATSYGIARALNLPPRMAVLIACGNSICGNSAIAAVAPIIGARSDEVASSIAFTAVLGVIVVLALPFLMPALGLSATQYGVLSGLTVYAVPQVLAATAPAGALAVQIGTLVKLVRVLMLGPVVLVLSLASSRIRGEAGSGTARGKIQFSRLVPWFIIGFLAMAALRTAGLIPEILLPALSTLAKLLTIVSMAALGLGVDIRTVAKAGPRVTLAVTLSLIGLAAISYGLIRLLGVA